MRPEKARAGIHQRSAPPTDRSAPYLPQGICSYATTIQEIGETQKDLKLKTNRLKPLSRLVVTSVMASALAACSGSDKPSESEAKQAIRTALGDCQRIEIHDFKKVNGIRQQDDSYVVQAKYTLDITPSEDIKSYITGDYKQALDDANQQVSSAKQFLDDYAQAKAAWVAENPGHMDFEYYRTLSPDDQSKYNQAGGTLNINNPVTSVTRAGREKIYELLHNECPNTPNSFFSSIVADNSYKVEDFAADIKREASNIEIHMVKSDNGWQLSQ
ncbi:hypothetical protein [Burkholderia aenigmatica]|uniref:hypothetical protein n=1 Tax=Burkholderia aenigmatica TaxID=2015348 RepID=UPI0011779CA5|nr:hypothetical protein [Burkholderia aenigmatica]